MAAEPARTARLRRAFDVVCAASLLALFSPIAALAAIAIRIDSPGPALYRGRRLGRGRRPFTIYKFRTLTADAERTIGSRLMTDHDRVVTRVGRVLRELKLDELPQLWNVLRGDMHLVGPRPVRPALDAGYHRVFNPDYELRFRVAPGLTGLAQVQGTYHTPIRQKAAWDAMYVRRRCAALDLRILVATVLIPIGGLRRLAHRRPERRKAWRPIVRRRASVLTLAGLLSTR